jgi:exopolysaccharide production protein ExoZ
MSAAPPGPKLTTLEYGRFLAASLVLFSHVPAEVPFLEHHPLSLFGGLHAPGPVGVEYFFTLSGFVILTAHFADLGHLSALPRFVWRRLARIYPAFWLTLALAFALPHPALSPLHALGLICLSATDINDYIGAAWTLRPELAFYSLFACLLIPRAAPVVLAIWLGLITWLAVPQPLRHTLNPVPLHGLHAALMTGGALWFNANNYLFAAGLFAAWHYRRRQIAGWFCALLLLLSALCLGLTAPYSANFQSYPHAYIYPLMAVGFGSLILALANLERAGIIPHLPAARFLGNLSYPLYLIHMPLMQLADTVCTGCLRLPDAALYVPFVVAVVLIYIAAAAVTLLFDQPLQRLLRGLV